jgi:hypothetical protein
MGHSMKTNGSMMQRSSTEHGVHTKQLTASEEIPQYSTTYPTSRHSNGALISFRSAWRQENDSNG